MATWT